MAAPNAERNKNIPSPTPTAGGNETLDKADAILNTGLVQSGLGWALVESNELVVPHEVADAVKVDFSQLENLAIGLSGAGAFYDTYVRFRSDVDWRYSTHKNDIAGSGKTGYVKVPADTDKPIPLNLIPEVHLCGDAAQATMQFEIFVVASKYFRLDYANRGASV